MNGIENRRTRNTDKPVPGCLGRVVNFFDLSTGVAGNRLLTDKQHFDGFGHSRRQPDAVRISPIGDELDVKLVVSELKKNSSNRNINGTSVKMLIAEEMSKESELKHNSPNLVAKLMGLESLPQRKPDSFVQRTHSRSYSGSNIGTGLHSWQQEHNRSPEQNRCKEFPDMTWQSRKGRYMRNKPPENERCAGALNEKKKMTLVRQKFVEAKSLAINKKQWQSKQYEDALEVLSSNRGLFLKLLEEPNLFSQKLHDLHCFSPPSNTKRITVLRPSKMVDDTQIPRTGKKNMKPSKKVLDVSQVNKTDKRNHEFPPPSSTRIVVLKPSGKPHLLKAKVSPSPSSPREHSEEMYREPLDDDILDSREMAKGSKEETFMSSIFSNGYSGDESSFHKSENEFLGNLSDSEVATPRFRQSWDYIHKFESPYGSSSFSQASCSPESSVCREAKKRLSERWALMSSNGNCHEQRYIWRSASTLGEMLAFSDTKEGIVEEQETRESPLCSTSNLNLEQFLNDSPRNLLRSNSVPNRVLDPKVGEADISKEIAKSNTHKSSFKEKFSSLFFSRNKRTTKDKSLSPQSKHEPGKPVTMLVQAFEKVSEGTSRFSSVIEEEQLQNLQELPGNLIAQDQIGMERKPVVISPEANLSLTNPATPQDQGKNQDQPSPVSVLEQPFEEDENNTTDSSNVEGDKHGSKPVAHSINSILIDKSSPIESIVRTLSWDDSCVDTATSYIIKPSKVSRGSEEEEKELLFLVKLLLSTAGFDGEVAYNSLFPRWHSPESPLDPSLRDSFIDINAKDITHEAKRTQMRSTRNLLFDCVNTALVEIIGYGLAKRGSECSPPSLLVDEVWARVKEWCPCEVPEEFLGDEVDTGGLVVEAMVRKEVVGNVWTECMRVETESFGTDMEAVLLEELLQELVFFFLGRV